MERKAFATRIGITLVAAALCAGCSTIDVDLSSSPTTVQIGQPVTFDVAVMNRSTCPVGGVTALLIPFIPRNLLINHIKDPEVFQAVSNAVDAFCFGSTLETPGEGGCTIANGEITCELCPANGNANAQMTAETLSTASNGSITCETNGSRLICHIPQSMVAMGEQFAADSVDNSLSPLVCGAGPNGQLGACFTLKLDPSETKTGQIVLSPTAGGLFRNFILAFATRDEGVCKTGTKGTPCSEDADCTGMSNTCGSGVCADGMNQGFGCDALGDCPGGTECVACTVPPDGQVLANLACTTTTVEVVAPAPLLSPRAMATAVLLLLGVGYVTFRRTRRPAD